MNKEITSGSYSILFKQNGFDYLSDHLNNINYSKIFVHVDNNTKKNCLDLFLNKINLEKYELIESKDGEENKNIYSCLKLWEIISDKNGDRNSLIINLGGGVVSDMGGFIASTYKRGINYINIPTTLLSMVDASIGGKTGIDFGILKNQIGTFYDPQMVIIEPDFLKTLQKEQISSGYAEILKHSLIYDLKTFNLLIKNGKTTHDINTIYDSVCTKNSIVLIDKKERKKRKSLNYGHTLGHAIESYFLNTEKKLLHGEAIAIGIVLASFISNKLFDFSFDYVISIKKHIDLIYSKIEINESEIESIIGLLIHDKKNSHGKINFVLLEDIAKPIYDVQVKTNLIKESFKYYLS